MWVLTVKVTNDGDTETQHVLFANKQDTVAAVRIELETYAQHVRNYCPEFTLPQFDPERCL